MNNNKSYLQKNLKENPSQNRIKEYILDKNNPVNFYEPILFEQKQISGFNVKPRIDNVDISNIEITDRSLLVLEMRVLIDAIEKIKAHPSNIFNVFVPLSHSSLLNSYFFEAVNNLSESKVTLNRVVVSIDKGMYINKTPRIISSLQMLKEKGFKLLFRNVSNEISFHSFNHEHDWVCVDVTNMSQSYIVPIIGLLNKTGSKIIAVREDEVLSNFDLDDHVFKYMSGQSVGEARKSLISKKWEIM